MNKSLVLTEKKNRTRPVKNQNNCSASDYDKSEIKKIQPYEVEVLCTIESIHFDGPSLKLSLDDLMVMKRLKDKVGS